jgi:hypothetical protein
MLVAKCKMSKAACDLRQGLAKGNGSNTYRAQYSFTCGQCKQIVENKRGVKMITEELDTIGRQKINQNLKQREPVGYARNYCQWMPLQETMTASPGGNRHARDAGQKEKNCKRLTGNRKNEEPQMEESRQRPGLPPLSRRVCRLV